MKQFRIQKTVTDRSDKSIEKYFNEINKFAPLSSQEEVDLVIKAKNGDCQALDLLINSNLKFVISVAKKYQHNGLDFSDLINEGNIGLIKAAHRFDETKGFKFISFAVWWIRQSIIQAISEKRRMIKVPSHKNAAGGKYLQAISNLSQKLERSPTDEEVSEYMEISVSDVILVEQSILTHSSLDAKISSDENSNSLIDLITDENGNETDYVLIDESLQKDMERALNILSEKEMYVIKSFYGIGCKELDKETIANKLNYTPERIRQLKKSAERKISQSESAKSILLKYI
jgi:RNA polymerase primary sigma factor